MPISQIIQDCYMTTSQPNLLGLAKQGNATAIATLTNRHLRPKGITAKVALKESCLYIILESSQIPEQKTLTAFVSKGVSQLKISSIETLKIYGKQVSENHPAWTQELELVGKLEADFAVEPISVINSKAQEPVDSQQSAYNHQQTSLKQEIPSSSGRVNMNSHSSSTAQKLVSNGKDFTAQLNSLLSIVPFGRTQKFKLSLVVLLIAIFLFLLGFNGISFLTLPALVIGCMGLVLLCISKEFKDLNAHTEEQHRKSLAKAQENAEKSKQSLILAKSKDLVSRNLLEPNEQIAFQQMASYRGGVRGYPNSAKSAGQAFILSNSLAFYDSSMTCKIYYKQLIDARLDFFQMGGVRGVIALGDVGRQLQQTKNILDLCYLDDEGTERNAKFQIHGALSIPGEAEKATEFLNHILEFKGQFLNRFSSSSSDPLFKLEKLQKLKDQGVITDFEFQEKKRKILDQL